MMDITINDENHPLNFRPLPPSLSNQEVPPMLRPQSDKRLLPNCQQETPAISCLRCAIETGSACDNLVAIFLASNTIPNIWHSFTMK